MQLLHCFFNLRSGLPPVKTSPAKALRWDCLAPYSKKDFGAMTLNLDTIDGAVTDWTGTEEIWVLMDVSAYSTQSVRFSFFFRSNSIWSISGEDVWAYLYSIDTGQWQPAKSEGYTLILPPGFFGWVRLPLSPHTFSTAYWGDSPVPFGAICLNHVASLSFGLEQLKSCVGRRAYVYRFVLHRIPWAEDCRFPEEGSSDWREIISFSTMDTGVRLGGPDDRQQWGYDGNGLAEITFSLAIDEPYEDYALLMAETPLLVQLEKKKVFLPCGCLLLCRARSIKELQGQEGIPEYHGIYMRLSIYDTAELEKQGIRSDEIISVENPIAVKEYIYCLTRGSQAIPQPSQTILENICWGLFFIISQSRKAASRLGVTQYDTALKLLRHRIYEEPGEAPTAEQAALELHVSPSTLRHIYVKLFEISYTADIISARICYAQRLLRETDIPLEGIAERCGYKTMPHFMRQFKKFSGQTPGSYRRWTRLDM